MSTAPDDGTGKKAVHVKWAGKTIALGTFPAAEADEKCARAKALTRAWRSTMRPKPTREWVMGELERLGVRIVSGKLGRKPEYEQDAAAVEETASNQHISGSIGGNMQHSGDGIQNMMAIQEQINQQRRDLGLGAAGGLNGLPQSSSGQQVNQHYEMLKLHHMNLLQELHETTMMMNMYQQQHLQQEQMKMQESQGNNMRRLSGFGSDSLHGSQRGSLGLGVMNPRGSLGLGSIGMGSAGFNPRGSLGFGSFSGGALLNEQMKADFGSKRESNGADGIDPKRHKTGQG